MARKVTTEYTCDSCGRQVKNAKDLRRFKVEQVKRSRGSNDVAAADLCSDCEPRLLAAVEPFFPSEELTTLHAMSRDEES